MGSKSPLQALGNFLLGVHIVGSFVAFFIFSYQFAREHGFFTWLFFGEIVPFFKSLVWEIFLIASLVSHTPQAHKVPQQLPSPDVSPERAISLSTDVDSLIDRALDCMENSDFEQALLYCSRAIDLAPNDPGAYVCRGLANSNLKRHDEAIRDFTAALKLAPDDVMIYLLRASAYGYQGRPEKSLQDCNSALRLEPGNPQIYLVRGMALFELNRFPDAAADFRKAMELSPEGSPIHEAAKTWLKRTAGHSRGQRQPK